MNKVIRVISALGAGASLVWGIARSMRRKRGSTDDGGPDWPPKDAEQAAKAAPQAPAPAKKPEPKKPEPQEPEPEAVSKPEEVDAPESDASPVVDAPADDASVEPPVVKGVAFENPSAVVALVNDVDEEGLKDLGIKGKANQRVLDTRPIETVHDLAVPGIGRRTLQALAGATE